MFDSLSGVALLFQTISWYTWKIMIDNVHKEFGRVVIKSINPIFGTHCYKLVIGNRLQYPLKLHLSGYKQPFYDIYNFIRSESTVAPLPKYYLYSSGDYTRNIYF